MWAHFSTCHFSCCIQKNQLHKLKFKSCGAFADMCFHLSHFCVENLRKKSKTGARWALRPWVFAHTSTMWWWKLLQNSWAGKLAMLCLHVVRMLWANFHHPKQFGANLGSFWCQMGPRPNSPSDLGWSVALNARCPAIFVAFKATQNFQAFFF